MTSYSDSLKFLRGIRLSNGWALSTSRRTCSSSPCGASWDFHDCWLCSLWSSTPRRRGHALRRVVTDARPCAVRASCLSSSMLPSLMARSALASFDGGRATVGPVSRSLENIACVHRGAGLFWSASPAEMAKEETGCVLDRKQRPVTMGLTASYVWGRGLCGRSSAQLPEHARQSHKAHTRAAGEGAHCPQRTRPTHRKLQMAYTNERLITSTRFSEVYRAQAPSGQTVALKVTSPDEERRPHCSRDELKILQSLRAEGGSPNVITLLDSFGRDLGDLVMVFPYYPLTLLPLLCHYATSQGPNPYTAYTMSRNANSSSDSDTSYSKPPQTRTWKSRLEPSAGVSIVKGLASGLAFLHAQGVIHRDIKPANIVFKNYDTSSPVIIDVGISYQYPDNFGKENPQRKICDVSTSIYKAPELIFHLTDYSYAMDIWSLGIVMTLIFSENVKPGINEEDIVDIRLISLLFEAFGTPTLDTWPGAKHSKTFTQWVSHLTHTNPRPVSELLPRAPTNVQHIFKKMMLYESSNRITAQSIVDELNEMS